MTKKFSFCKTCEKEFEYDDRNKKGIYCSQKCYDRTGDKNPRYGKGDNIKGEKNPNWKGGKRVISYRGKHWNLKREQALERDDYKCQKCKSEDNLIVHHIISYFAFKNCIEANKLDNLITLCKKCHGEAHKKDKFGVSIRVDDDSVLAPDYLEKLFRTYKREKIFDEKVGGVGGIVPSYGSGILRRDNHQLINGIFNEVKFDKKGVLEMKDDGGFEYLEEDIYETHHLRSSFLINNEAIKEGCRYDTAFGNKVCFREETDFSFQLLEKGYKLFTDTGALCWHLRTSTGGCRFSPEEYAESAGVCDEYFRKKWKKKYKEGFRV